MADIGVCALLCGGFIGSFYLWPKERLAVWMAINDLDKASLPGPRIVDRNEPSVIKRRMISFLSCTGVNFGLLEYLLRLESTTPIYGSAVIASLVFPKGRVLESLSVTIASGFATLTLLSGTLFDVPVCGDILDKDRICILRDLVVCPVGEELFFRALLFNILKKRSTLSSIVISSALFALSHTHHIFGSLVDLHRTAREDGEPDVTPLKSWKRAVMGMTHVYTYTFIYGLLSGFYYSVVCRRNLPAVVLSHSLCNLIGAPRWESLLEESTLYKVFRVSLCACGVLGWVCMLRIIGEE